MSERSRGGIRRWRRMLRSKRRIWEEKEVFEEEVKDEVQEEEK